MKDQNDVAPGRWLAYTPAFLLVALLLLSVQLLRRADHGRADVRQIEQVRLLTLRSLSSLQEAETGQRGYLLTGNPGFQSQYRAAGDSVMKKLADLQELTKEEPTQQRYLRTLIPLVHRRIARLDETAQIRNSLPAEKAATGVSLSAGLAMMDSARAIFADMWAAETRLQNRFETRERADQLLLEWALGIGFVIAAIASYLIGSRLSENAMRHWMMTADLNARIAMLREHDPARRSGEIRTMPTGNDVIT